MSTGQKFAGIIANSHIGRVPEWPPVMPHRWWGVRAPDQGPPLRPKASALRLCLRPRLVHTEHRSEPKEGRCRQVEGGDSPPRPWSAKRDPRSRALEGQESRVLSGACRGLACRVHPLCGRPPGGGRQARRAGGLSQPAPQSACGKRTDCNLISCSQSQPSRRTLTGRKNALRTVFSDAPGTLALSPAAPCSADSSEGAA